VVFPEEWRPFPIENNRCQVSSLGRIKDASGKIIDHCGSICLHVAGKRMSISVRRLAELAFAPQVQLIKNSRRRRGGNHVKLAAAQVLEIRRQGAIDHSGAALQRLAAAFGVSLSAIEDAIFFRTWKHLPGDPPPRLPRGRPRKRA
jgi:hypothetical protein